MRADAQRSYDRILAVAGDVFVEQGSQASMNEIAKRAGVGSGTLYRHFPTRDHLLDVLLTDWVGEIQAAADQLVATAGPPREVLIAWFEAFIAHVSVHSGGAARVTATLGDVHSPMVRKWQALVAANSTVLRYLEDLGVARPAVDSIQICRLVGGAGSVAELSGLDRAQTRGLLELIADAVLVDDEEQGQPRKVRSATRSRRASPGRHN